MTLTPEREAEIRRWNAIRDLLVALDETRRERDEAREALRELAAWQPHTLLGLAYLHPQHERAVRDTRHLLGQPATLPAEGAAP